MHAQPGELPLQAREGSSLSEPSQALCRHAGSLRQVRNTYVHTSFAVSSLSWECDFPPLCSLESTGSDTTSHLSQIKMLTDRKRELEHRLSAMMEENDLLQGTVEELQDRVLILERQSHDKDLQVRRQQWDREGRGEWNKTCGLG